MCMRVQHRYYCVGLPVGYLLLGFHSPLAVYSLACGVALGTWAHTKPLAWVLLLLMGVIYLSLLSP